MRADWSEIDAQERTWTIPGAKMKCREAHVVYLSDRAVEILRGQEGQHKSIVFPSPTKPDAPMSNMGLAMMLRRLRGKGPTVHGFRASFSTWANELGVARPDVIEAALAHNERDRVRRAYNRALFMTERRTLMARWTSFLECRSFGLGESPRPADVAMMPLQSAA